MAPDRSCQLCTRIARVGRLSFRFLMNDRRWLYLGWLAVLVAVVPFFLFRAFAVDWVNHVWLTGHYAATLRETGQFPSFLNVAYLEAGWPNLYGYLFYPLLSLAALGLGPDFAMRAAAIVSLAAAFEVWRRVGRRLIGPGLPSVLCGLAVAVHPYLLTNLYNRSALTEFFGLEWFGLVLAAVVRWLAQDSWPRRAPAWVIFGAFVGVALIAGTHPITIYLGAIVLGPVLVALAIGWRWRPDRAQLAWAAFGLAVAALLTFRWVLDSREWMSRIAVSATELNYAATFDGALQRFSPVPLDPRMWREDFAHWKLYTPFLEAPVNWLVMVAALAGAWGAWRQPRGAGVFPSRRPVVCLLAAVAVLAVTVAVSLSPDFGTGSKAVAACVQRVFGPMQFTYRIAGPVQIGAVLCLLLAFRGAATAAPTPVVPRNWLRIALGVALAGIAVKVGVLCATLPTMQRGVVDWAVRDYAVLIGRTSEHPATFYGLFGYAKLGEHDPGLSHVTAVDHELKLARDPRAPWRTLDVPLEALRGKLAGTNLVSSPFLTLDVDGWPLTDRQLGDPDRRLVFRVPPEANVLHAGVGRSRHAWLNFLPRLWLVAAAGVVVLAWRDFAAQRRAAR